MLPYIKTIAKKGIKKSILEDSEIKSAVNLYNGTVANQRLAESLGFTCKGIDAIIKP